MATYSLPNGEEFDIPDGTPPDKIGRFLKAYKAQNPKAFEVKAEKTAEKQTPVQPAQPQMSPMEAANRAQMKAATSTISQPDVGEVTRAVFPTTAAATDKGAGVGRKFTGSLYDLATAPGRAVGETITQLNKPRPEQYQGPVQGEQGFLAGMGDVNQDRGFGQNMIRSASLPLSFVPMGGPAAALFGTAGKGLASQVAQGTLSGLLAGTGEEAGRVAQEGKFDPGQVALSGILGAAAPAVVKGIGAIPKAVQKLYGVTTGAGTKGMETASTRKGLQALKDADILQTSKKLVKKIADNELGKGFKDQLSKVLETMPEMNTKNIVDKFIDSYNKLSNKVGGASPELEAVKDDVINRVTLLTKKWKSKVPASQYDAYRRSLGESANWKKAFRDVPYADQILRDVQSSMRSDLRKAGTEVGYGDIMDKYSNYVDVSQDILQHLGHNLRNQDLRAESFLKAIGGGSRKTVVERLKNFDEVLGTEFTKEADNIHAASKLLDEEGKVPWLPTSHSISQYIPSAITLGYGSLQSEDNPLNAGKGLLGAMLLASPKVGVGASMLSKSTTDLLSKLLTDPRTAPLIRNALQPTYQGENQ